MLDITPEDLLSRTKPNGDCLEWTGTRGAQNYGLLSRNSRNHLAHRVLYATLHGVELTRHQFVCHSCDNPPCINPEHLWLGTAGDNARDRAAKGRGRSNEKLTPEQVRQIRKIHAAGVKTIDRLAYLFDVKPTTIRKVVDRKSWKHVA